VVVMKSIIFWDVTPCSLLCCNRRFGGTYRLHRQGRRNIFSKNQQISRWQAETRLHCMASQKTELLMLRCVLNNLYDCIQLCRTVKILTTLYTFLPLGIHFYNGVFFSLGIHFYHGVYIFLAQYTFLPPSIRFTTHFCRLRMLQS
jgi:hypothetical protein